MEKKQVSEVMSHIRKEAWAKIPKEERSRIMSERRKKGIKNKINKYAKKWIEIFGCPAVYSKGYLFIYKNMKVHNIPGLKGGIVWMVMGEYKNYLRISPDGFTISIIKKSFCKII